MQVTLTVDQAKAVLEHLANTTPAQIPSGQGANPRLVHDAFDCIAIALAAETKDTKFLPIDPNIRKVK